jgi:hypothetical protein
MTSLAGKTGISSSTSLRSCVNSSTKSTHSYGTSVKSFEAVKVYLFSEAINGIYQWGSSYVFLTKWTLGSIPCSLNLAKESVRQRSRDSTRAINPPFTIVTLRLHQLGQKAERVLGYLPRRNWSISLFLGLHPTAIVLYVLTPSGGRSLYDSPHEFVLVLSLVSTARLVILRIVVPLAFPHFPTFRVLHLDYSIPLRLLGCWTVV